MAFCSDKKLLQELSNDVPHEEVLRKIAIDSYGKLMKHLKNIAVYGYKETRMNIIATLRPMKNIPNTSGVLRYIREMLVQVGNFQEKDDFLLEENGDLWISWKEPKRIPVLTARDLVQAGYDPGKQERFRVMLEAVRTALIRGELENDLVSTQVAWIRKRFPL
jgi:hypothetical protein